MDNAVQIPLSGSLDPRAINDLRRYLRKMDIGGGYIPQIVYSAWASRQWTMFWFAVRRIDDLVDRKGFGALRSITERGEPADFLLALRCFVEESAIVLDSHRRVREIATTLTEERRFLARRLPGPARELFAVWYPKSYVPTYVGYRLLLRRSSKRKVRLLAKLIGAGLQWMDDLCDLAEDLRAGKLWLTQEEFAIMGLDGADAPIPWSVATRLRERLSLTYLLAAYDIALTLRSAPERRRVTLFLGEVFRVFLRGKFRIRSEGVSGPWGGLGVVLQHLPGPEGVKYRILHALNEAYVASNYSPADIEAVRRRLDALGGCPPQLAPEVCLMVLGQLEQHVDRSSTEAVPKTRLTLAELAELLGLDADPLHKWSASHAQGHFDESPARS